MKIPSHLNEAIEALSLNDLQGFRQLSQDVHDYLTQAFSHQPVSDLLSLRATLCDRVLDRLWQLHQLEGQTRLALIAVGGYGRGELHPYSDVDILVLTDGNESAALQSLIGNFITSLWDSKLDVGHAVRSVRDCTKMAMADITIATNLLEARLLKGNRALFNALRRQLLKRTFWPSKAFFDAKYSEQVARHQKYHSTAYILEPNLKAGPGGLRDIQTLFWVAKRHLDYIAVDELVTRNYLTEDEFSELMECQEYLWQMRFALQLVAKRNENRLLFDYQPEMAEKMGFGEGKAAVESMMKRYFRVLQRVTELNQVLLEHFSAQISPPHQQITQIGDKLEIVSGKIKATDKRFFYRPENVLKLFLAIADYPEISGIHTDTLRKLRNARRRTHEGLCDYAQCRQLFMQLLKHPRGPGLPMTLMHKHGILAMYLPEWRNIVGQMQFDLFHAYTVDEHTYRLLRNLYRFTLSSHNQEFPLCSNIMKRMQKPELLYLAGIFHDIAKGRGGDHSELGAIDAHKFCRFHGLSDYDSKLVAWLVEQHLLMSTTAQRKDINDPEVVRHFALIVRDETHLDYLYCLTVADIRATNDNLWNSWKASLLRELYFLTQKAFRRGLEKPVDLRARIRDSQANAKAELAERGIAPEQVDALWARFKADYFLRFSPSQLAWQASLLLSSPQQAAVKVLPSSSKGGSEVFVFAKDRDGLFSDLVATLDKLNVSVYDAKILNTRDNFALDNFIVLEHDGSDIFDRRRIEEIHQAIVQALEKSYVPRVKRQKIDRKVRQFNVKNQIEFLPSINKHQSLLEMVALDYPGLLSQVASVFDKEKITLHGAKITTIGERVEDVFALSDQGHALDEATQLKVKDALMSVLTQTNE